MNAYLTRDGDTIDSIAWHIYGRESAIKEIMAANPRLCEEPPILSAGMLITLPTIATLPAIATQTVRLWGTP